MKSILRTTILKVMPDDFVENYRAYKQKRVIKQAAREEAKKYSKYANLRIKGSSDEGIEELLIFHTHSIEKGLSHPRFRPNFGKNALTKLKANLEEFNQLGLDKDSFSYQNAISVLRSYKEKHQNMQIETPNFDSLFGNINLASASMMAGAKKFANSLNDGVDFKKVETSRYTQREFADGPLDEELYQEALSMAMKSPSVCNRQPWHVFFTQNKAKIEQLISIQSGFKGYGLPPSLSIVTVDRRAFLGPYERNEPYIDGGIFLMNFDMCLTSVGLASCILNLMLPTNELDKLRNILKIDDAQVMIAMVAVGQPKQQLLVAKSARKDSATIFTEIQ